MNAQTRKPARKVPDGAKAEKNIYKRGEYSYQVKMMIGGHTIVETFDTLPEARAFRDSKKAASVLDPDFKRVLESRIKKTEAASSSLSWLLDRYESEVTHLKKSAVSEKYRIGKLKRFDIASRSIYTITADDVSEFLRDLKADGVAAPGQRKYCALLSHVYNTAAKRWRLKVSNPITTMELPSAGKARDRRLEKGEAETLLAALEKENTYAARAQIEAGKAQRAGLVATNSIRGGASRKVLERIAVTAPVFEAWSDEAWINNGAAVRVSLVCFGKNSSPVMLDGQPVVEIHADLTAGNETSGALDLTLARPLAENADTCFAGTKKYGDFDIPGELARQWLTRPNPNGRPNADVVKPWANGKDITARPSDTWIIDFGTDMPEANAALYETPFGHVVAHVKAYRQTVNRERTRRRWWIHEEARVSMRKALNALPRFIVTPQTAKYRLFVYLRGSMLPDQALNVITRADDTTFGILHSRFHELWALQLGTSLEDRPRYTPSFTFETFPFPAGLTPRDIPTGPQAEAIATTAKQLDTLRCAWLNPPEWVDWVRTKEEEQADFPLRPVAKPGHEAELKKRTLTNLYNARPAWLDNAHRELDVAVAAAYGWADYSPEMSDEEILRRLLELNRNRAAAPPHGGAGL